MLHCYCQLYSYGQCIFSTNFNIIKEVNEGDIIFKKFLEDIWEFEDFYRVGNYLGFKIVKKISMEFTRIITRNDKIYWKNGLNE